MKKIFFRNSILLITLFIICSCKKDEQPTDQEEVIIDNIWKGKMVTFSKDTQDDWTLINFQDSISPNVILTRANKQSLFNIKMETGSSNDSPLDTEWALGSIDDIESLEFCNFKCIAKGKPYEIVDQPLVLHLISDDIYLSIIFHIWGGGNSGDRGAISYSRSTPIGYPDADSDGVRDLMDQCPQTPADVQVNIFGCEADQ
jgi:hypothetical protein